MLEPITALGLTGSVVQIVDFTAKVLSKGSKQGRKRDLVDHARLMVVTSDLKGLSENLKRSLIFDETSVELDENDKALNDIAGQCVDAAGELVARLSKLTQRDGRTLWASIRHAVISVWSKEEVNEMLSRLDTYRSELALRTLVLLNEKVGGHMENHGQRFDRLELKDDDIIEAISISQRKFAREAATYHQQTQEQLQEVITAILTHRDGQTTTISQPIPQSTSWVSTKDNHSRQCMTLQSGKPSSKSMVKATASLSDFTIVQSRVLESLSFRKIRDREDEVAPAHHYSFNWVFETPKPSQRPWNSLAEWMRTGQGCYWINGKAGSGKSTLMKYIVNSAMMKKALLEWAAGTQLLVASYFSWNLGSPLQKTHIGLLRSLLHDILVQVPDLVPTVLPKLCRAAWVEAKEEPTLIELKTGILRLAQQTSIPLRICLFIDGIDEFEDDHVDIANLLGSIPSTQCKIVLSSRPSSVCVDAFANCSSLRLQDLTYDDIRSYISEKVRTHKRWRDLLDEEGQEAERLVDATAEKAEGVFLWVILAVASLLEGLRNYDRLMDFQRRLEILPPDLENLYSHMLNKMQSLYLRHASQLLQIVLQHTQFEVDQPLSALQLSFADEENPECAFSQEIRPLSIKSQLGRCKAMEGRLRSRCCGLVEIWQDWRLGQDDRILKSRVIFLHRTVVEFLGNSKVMNDLRLQTIAIGFDPNIALAKGFLIDVKTRSDTRLPDIVQSTTWQSMRRCLDFCRIADLNALQRYEPILDELDKTMEAHWSWTKRGEGETGTCERDSSTVSQNFSWAALELRQACWLGDFKGFDLSQASMLILAATMGMRQYVYHRCMLPSSDIKYAQLQQAMRAAIFRASRLLGGHAHSMPEYSPCTLEATRSIPLETYKCIIDDLLNAGAGPNDSLGADGYSPWALALTFTHTMKFETKTVEWCHMLSLMLKAGANPNESVKQDREYLVRHKTILSLLTSKISSLSAEQRRRNQTSDQGVIQSLEDLKAILLQRGAENREWSEPKVRKHERDSTPAPWISNNPGSTRKSRLQQSMEKCNRRMKDMVDDVLVQDSSSSEEHPDPGSTRLPVRRGRSPRRSRVLLDDDSNSSGKDMDTGSTRPSPRNDQQYKSSEPRSKQLKVVSHAQSSPVELEDSCDTPVLVDSVKNPDHQKSKLLSSFSSRFQLFQHWLSRSRN